MKLIVMAAVASIALAASGAANAQEALAKSDGCLNCHDVSAQEGLARHSGRRRQIQGQGGCGGDAHQQDLQGRGTSRRRRRAPTTPKALIKVGAVA